MTWLIDQFVVLMQVLSFLAVVYGLVLCVDAERLMEKVLKNAQNTQLGNQDANVTGALARL